MANDPYKYFRVEARELLDGLQAGVLELERGKAATSTVAKLLRLAHTLKGAARVVKQARIAELSHELEGVLSSHREAAALSQEAAGALFKQLDEVRRELRALELPADRPAEAQRPAQAKEAPESIDAVRVPIDDLDSLLRGATEAGVLLGSLRRDLQTVEHLRDLSLMLREQVSLKRAGSDLVGSPRTRGLVEELGNQLERLRRELRLDVERVGNEVSGVRELTQRMRLVQAQTVFPALERAARDAAEAQGKRVEWSTQGGEVRLDANVLSALRGALLHVVRNAVAHGIESERERTSRAKPAVGRVHLTVERRGDKVRIVCSDDGRGLSMSAIREAAVRKGHATPEQAQAMTDRQLTDLLLAGGLSTADALTEISGRGIGLDVVRDTALQLKGQVELTSEPGRGLTLGLLVPLSIASITGLLLEAAGSVAVVPLDNVRRTLRVRPEDLVRRADSDTVAFEGQMVPFLPLERALSRGPGRGRMKSVCSAVVVQSGERLAAVGVDRLIGTACVVLRPLPSVIAAEPLAGGACLDAEGNPQLVLDPLGLIQAAEAVRAVEADAPLREKLPVLVVDDSLTTRMLEKSILESAGFEVALATSAEEGLVMARARRYALFMVDVEMPGIDGFEFVALTRKDPELSKTPAVLVTSRDAPEDRKKGELAGARAYIVKGDFEQGHLLRTIRSLVG
ncbi:MAG: response regulator [Deltaproteobacteria bacterium]|nr:response regulator [Deltaproteobacteria bacterium]